MALSPKHRKYCEQFVIHFDRGKAYQDSGFKVKTKAIARKNASRLMTTNADVRNYIAELLAVQKKRAEKDAAEIIAELEKLGFSNIKDYLSFDEDGVTLKDSTELTDEQLAAISEVSEVIGRGGVRGVRFKLHDKKGSLELLGRRFGLFPNREVQSKDTEPLKPFKVILTNE